MKFASMLRALLASVTLAATACVGAAPVLQVNSEGILTGAKGVNVQGTLYDVTFVKGTCIALFNGCDEASDFTFQDENTATAAMFVLLHNVFVDGPAGAFNTSAGKIFGCPTGNTCYSITPYLPAAESRFELAGVGNSYDSGDFGFGGAYDRTFDTASYGFYNFAQFQLAATVVTDPAGVPEPGSLALLGVAMAGLAAARRRKQ